MNRIGLVNEEVKELSVQLNDLLANYQIFYMNVRGFHWNIKGDKFFELHVKFEELYNDILLKVDEIAERVLTLGESPVHSYTSYISSSEIQEVVGATDANTTVGTILDGLEVLIKKQRVLLDLSDRYGDEGTNALMSDYIREQEKLVWMYTAFMG
ncbi:DNA starvation/stationary phase protection protein [Halosquirtibacter laminarini]|uniref:DNA starvation/stationary phase protection protein n=1 Tax=Halosquirtibacter laminarini TaxID=3374600 RepID=A0AC61NEY6_9BACT|nr:DNA starvation/stationary phase protection protein [Prolixibacteraceae bacterium]